jgi:hypothetical protein
MALGKVFPQVLRFSPVIFITPVLHYLEKQKNWSSLSSSSSQGCTISLKTAVRPQHLLRGPSPQKNSGIALPLRYHYRPGQALRAPGGRGSQISRQSAHEGGKDVSPMHRLPLPPRNISGTHFCKRLVDPRAIARSERLCQWKIPMTPSGIELATSRLVAQCDNA